MHLDFYLHYLPAAQALKGAPDEDLINIIFENKFNKVLPRVDILPRRPSLFLLARSGYFTQAS